MFHTQMRVVYAALSMLVVVLVLGSLIFFWDSGDTTPQENKITDVRCYGVRMFSETDSGGDAYLYYLAKLQQHQDNTVIGNLSYYETSRSSNKGVSTKGLFTGFYHQEEGAYHGVYELTFNGQTHKEERFIKQTSDGITFGFGEMVKDSEGTYRYLDTATLNFDYALPLVSCERYDAWEQERLELNSI